MAYTTLSVWKTTYLSLIRPFFLSLIVRKHVLWQDGSPQPWIWHRIIYGVNVCLSVFSGLYPEHCSSEQSIDIERGKGDGNNLCLSLCMLYFLCFQMEKCPVFFFVFFFLISVCFLNQIGRVLIWNVKFSSYSNNVVKIMVIYESFKTDI